MDLRVTDTALRWSWLKTRYFRRFTEISAACRRVSNRRDQRATANDCATLRPANLIGVETSLVAVASMAIVMSIWKDPGASSILTRVTCPVCTPDPRSCRGFPQESMGIPRRRFSHIPTKLEVKSDSGGLQAVVS